MMLLKTFACLVVMTIVCVGCASTDAGKSGSCPCPQAKEPPKLLRHVVLFKFKDDATPDQIKAVEDAFRALPGKIDTIRDFEWGTNVSVENLAQGYTHCFFVTFQDEAGRAAYLPHPDHKAFGKVLHPYLDKVLVVDYWVKK